MLAKRIIPCLDIKNGRTVKGINFEGLRDAGDPIELARRYSQAGADELVFLDITATHEKRQILGKLVDKIAQVLDIPFTVGGGIKSLEDVEMLLQSGADKIAINSAAIRQPKLIEDLAKQFGSQCIVLAVDAKQNEANEWKVYLSGGRVETDWYLEDWVKRGQDLGAGELLFTSMNHDGTKEGFAVEMLAKLNQQLSIPIIASGGAGKKEDFREVFQESDVSAALAASVFHYGEIPIPDLKNYLSKHQICVR
ncbi:MAG: imidazole glycerol phosphate synthase subunit HisF [Saprospiraceae bacterium]|nr:imidazole glycerol phosphate synthase subunit HisF [Saprospiraceae bacterium]